MRRVAGRDTKRAVRPGTWKRCSQCFGARGIGSASRFAQERELLAKLALETSMAAATLCSDEADFRRRVREAFPWEGPGH